MKNLEIADFSELVMDSIPNKFCKGTIIEKWDKKSASLPNQIWIKRFWLFLAENLARLERESQKGQKENIDNPPIERLCSYLIMNLGACSFLPVSLNGSYRLFPLSKGKHVLKVLRKPDCHEQLALTQLNVPLLDDESMFCFKEENSYSDYRILKISNSLVATVDNVLDILDCVHFNRMSLNLDESACAVIVDFFIRHIEKFKDNANCIMKLRCLPFYYGLVDRFTTLSEKEIYVLPDEMPDEGLNEFAQKSGTVFRRQKSLPMYFFEYLGVITRTATELYVYNILPNFNHMPTEAILHHLKYIKDIIIPQLKHFSNKKSKNHLSVLEELLRNIAFIPVERYRLACASEFFNPHKEMFKIENQLCRPSELPPPPYDEQEWEEFLIHCGMKNDVTLDIFLDFANRLERLADLDGITTVVIENSKRMVTTLFSDPKLSETYSWQRIQTARFLTPHNIQQVLLTLAPKLERQKQLLCFRDATLPSNELLVWTVMGIISEDVSNIMNKADVCVAVKKFGLLECSTFKMCIRPHSDCM